MALTDLIPSLTDDAVTVRSNLSNCGLVVESNVNTGKVSVNRDLWLSLSEDERGFVTHILAEEQRLNATAGGNITPNVTILEVD